MANNTNLTTQNGLLLQYIQGKLKGDKWAQSFLRSYQWKIGYQFNEYHRKLWQYLDDRDKVFGMEELLREWSVMSLFWLCEYTVETIFERIIYEFLFDIDNNEYKNCLDGIVSNNHGMDFDHLKTMTEKSFWASVLKIVLRKFLQKDNNKQTTGITSNQWIQIINQVDSNRHRYAHSCQRDLSSIQLLTVNAIYREENGTPVFLENIKSGYALYTEILLETIGSLNSTQQPSLSSPH